MAPKKEMSQKIRKIYSLLLKEYGHQGWWPLIDRKGSDSTKGGAIKGYHPKDYSYPKNERQKLEILIGCILAQNTSWRGAQKAVLNLHKQTSFNLKRLNALSDGKIKEAIKPSGYFNEKTKKLREFLEFYKNLRGRAPSREELLGVWGIGEETADSMLLYAYKIPQFVVDAYAKRICIKLKFIGEKAKYREIKGIFEDAFAPRNGEKTGIFNEYHALIVEHAKRHYSRKPYALDCFLERKLKLKRSLT